MSTKIARLRFGKLETNLGGGNLSLHSSNPLADKETLEQTEHKDPRYSPIFVIRIVVYVCCSSLITTRTVQKSKHDRGPVHGLYLQVHASLSLYNS